MKNLLFITLLLFISCSDDLSVSEDSPDIKENPPEEVIQSSYMLDIHDELFLFNSDKSFKSISKNVDFFSYLKNGYVLYHSDNTIFLYNESNKMKTVLSDYFEEFVNLDLSSINFLKGDDYSVLSFDCDSNLCKVYFFEDQVQTEIIQPKEDMELVKHLMISGKPASCFKEKSIIYERLACYISSYLTRFTKEVSTSLFYISNPRGDGIANEILDIYEGEGFFILKTRHNNDINYFVYEGSRFLNKTNLSNLDIDILEMNGYDVVMYININGEKRLYVYNVINIFLFEIAHSDWIIEPNINYEGKDDKYYYFTMDTYSEGRQLYKSSGPMFKITSGLDILVENFNRFVITNDGNERKIFRNYQGNFKELDIEVEDFTSYLGIFGEYSLFLQNNKLIFLDKTFKEFSNREIKSIQF